MNPGYYNAAGAELDLTGKDFARNYHAIALHVDEQGRRCHHLKSHPQNFRDVLLHLKRSEIRRNDRDYRAGDTLLLQDWDTETSSYIGHQMYANVIHVEDCTPFGLPGFVVLSLSHGGFPVLVQECGNCPLCPLDLNASGEALHAERVRVAGGLAEKTWKTENHYVEEIRFKRDATALQAEKFNEKWVAQLTRSEKMEKALKQADYLSNFALTCGGEAEVIPLRQGAAQKSPELAEWLRSSCSHPRLVATCNRGREIPY